MCHCWNMYHRWDLGSTTLKKSSEILDFCKWFWVIIWPFLGQYLSFGVKWGLYEHYRDTPRPTRTLLVHITPSRTGFRVILVHRDPCDNSEVSVRARSFVTTYLVETCFFLHWMTQKTLANGRTQFRRRKTSPHTPESDENWPLWTEKCTWSWWDHFILCDFGFSDFYFMWIMIKN